MIVNLYLVEVRDTSNIPVDFYYYVTDKIMKTYEEQKAYTLTLKLLSQLNTEPEVDFYKSLKFFFNKRNIDCYYLNTFTKEHYYMPATLTSYTIKDIPMSHTYPSLKIANIKTSKDYQERTYKDKELLIERHIYNLSLSPKSLFEELNTYLKTPNAQYYYSYYKRIGFDMFKSFLLVIRDYLTTAKITSNLYLYSYMGSFQMLGYYSKPSSVIEEWLKSDRGKDLRQNLILLPFTMSPIIALWQSFCDNVSPDDAEDDI